MTDCALASYSAIGGKQLRVTDSGFAFDLLYSLSSADCEDILTFEATSSPTLSSITVDNSTKKLHIGQVNDSSAVKDYRVAVTAKIGGEVK